MKRFLRDGPLLKVKGDSRLIIATLKLKKIEIIVRFLLTRALYPKTYTQPLQEQTV